MDNESLRENIYTRRKELGLSQECVAEQVDISLNAYIKIEKGPTNIFNPKFLKIARALDTTPEALLFGKVMTVERHNVICEGLKVSHKSAIDGLNKNIAEKELFIKRLNEMVSDRDEKIAELKEKLSELQQMVAELQQKVSELQQKREEQGFIN